MNSFIENLYPTPIQVSLFENQELDDIQKEMCGIIQSIKWVKIESWGNTHWLSTDNFQQNDIERYNLTKFSHYLNRELKRYCDYIGFVPRKYKMISWFTKFDENDFGHAHTHGTADISGCYYFQTNTSDGNFYFLSPNTAATSSLPYEGMNQQWEYSPSVGKMLLFPGWLYHGIKRNNTINERISFSFNIHFER